MMKDNCLRKIALLALPLLALAAAYACGSGSDNASGAKGNSVSASCASIDKLDSYRYSINVSLQSPAFSSSPSASPGAPLSAFARTLNALLSDFQVHGAHVAPDRTQTILQFQQDELELRAIGDKQWERFGDSWQERTAASADASLLTPRLVCDKTVVGIASVLDNSKASEETLNGVKTNHYTVDKGDLSQLQQLLKTGSTNPPDKFHVDVWLARDGNWPVKLDISTSDKDEKGNPVGWKLLMEFRDVNDTGISIDAPLLPSPAG